MQQAKQPRFPFFDFSEHPLDPEGLRAHFAESVDAITVCRFSEAGRNRLESDRPYERSNLTADYKLNGRDERGRAKWLRYNARHTAWLPTPIVGADMMSAGLLADTVKFDAFVHGAHPVGTCVRISTEDLILLPDSCPYLSLAHFDSDTQRIEENQSFRVYDLHSRLPTLYGKQQIDPSGRRHYGDLMPFAVRHTNALNGEGNFARSSGLERLLADPDYHKALAQANAMQAVVAGDEYSITARTDLTLHMKPINQTGEPIRRPRASVIIFTPQP